MINLTKDRIILLHEQLIKSLLMIDEISMVNSNMLDMILRHVEIVNNRRLPRALETRVVLFGDPMQLGPVFQRDKLSPMFGVK